MKKRTIILMVGVAAALNSCHIYKQYERPDDLVVEDLYRDPANSNGSLVGDSQEPNFGHLPWNEVFTDPHLQTLIKQALESNADLRGAALTVEQAQAGLTASRLAYLPAFTLAPTGTVGSFDGVSAATYSIPASASWQLDLFGQLLNPNRKAKVSFRQAQYYQQAVQTQIVAAVANMYYTLLMLDRQLQISQESAALLNDMVEATEAMKEAAMTNSASVEQTRANYAQVMASIPGIKRSIRETENALCLVLNIPGQPVERGTLDNQQFPDKMSAGVPLQMLSNRPDVMAAEMALAACYYDTNTARAAFYPQITINGQIGWTNSAGGAVMNPGKLLTTAVGTITQPLFYRGRLVTALKQAKAAEEKAKLQFQTSLLKAGNEVSNALYQYEMNAERAVSCKMQVAAARKAANDTRELFQLGTSSYLEVLSAQTSYLNAQLSEVNGLFDRMQAVISLYQALGGGKENEPLNDMNHD